MDAPAEPEPMPEPVIEDVEPEAPPPGQSTGSYSFLRSFAPGTTPSRPVEDVLPASPEDEEPE